MNGSELYIGTPSGVVLCIDSISDELQLGGRIYHSYSKEAAEFSSMTQALLFMEKFYDSIKFPFPGTNDRHFGIDASGSVVVPYKRWERPTRKLSDSEMLRKSGEKGTFIIRVEQRQHSSWQGRVTWVESGETVAFRSALELLKLIDEALESGGTLGGVEEEPVEDSGSQMEAV